MGGGVGGTEEMFNGVVARVLTPCSGPPHAVPLSSLPTAAGSPLGDVYYGWVNLLINIQPLDHAFPRWPIKTSNWQSSSGAAGCRGARAGGCDRRCELLLAKEQLSSPSIRVLARSAGKELQQLTRSLAATSSTLRWSFLASSSHIWARGKQKSQSLRQKLSRPHGASTVQSADWLYPSRLM